MRDSVGLDILDRVNALGHDVVLIQQSQFLQPSSARTPSSQRPNAPHATRTARRSQAPPPPWPLPPHSSYLYNAHPRLCPSSPSTPAHRISSPSTPTRARNPHRRMHAEVLPRRKSQRQKVVRINPVLLPALPSVPPPPPRESGTYRYSISRLSSARAFSISVTVREQ